MNGKLCITYIPPIKLIMKKIVVLLLTIILSYDHIEASSKNANGSESNHPETSNDCQKSEKVNIRWTPELKSELLDLWEETDPTKEGHSQRLYDKWLETHAEYCNVKAKTLKIYAEKFIRTWKGPIDERHTTRLQTLNSLKKFRWPEKLKKSLMKCHVESLGSKRRLQQLWIQHNPKYANLDATYLQNSVNHFKTQAIRARSRKEDAAKVIWDEKLKAELINIWDETYSSDRKSGHIEKLYKEWKQRHPDLGTFAPEYLKTFANSLIQEDTVIRIARGESSETLQHRLEYMNRVQHRISWTPKMISDLLEIWNKLEMSIEQRSELWKKLHPEYVNVSAIYLAKMSSYFGRIHRAERRVEATTPSSEDHSRQLEKVIDHDYGTSPRKTLQLHQSTTIQQIPYAPHFGGIQHEYGESSSRTPRLHESTGYQHTPYRPRFRTSQHEYGESSSGKSRSHKSTGYQNTPYAPQFGEFQHDYGESSSRTPRLQKSTGYQHTPYTPRFRASQDEYGESSSGKSRLHKSTGNQHTPYPSQAQGKYDKGSSEIAGSRISTGDQLISHTPRLRGPHHEYDGNSSETRRLHHFFPTDTHLNPTQQSNFHQEHDTIPSSSPALELNNQDQRAPQHKRGRRITTLLEQLRRSKSCRVGEDLDLDLHLR